MNSTERQDFEGELAVLFAAFPPLRMQPAHVDAYWRGLAKMTMPMFRRVLERVLDPEKGEERLPSPKRLWQIHREIRSESRAQAQPPAKDDRPFDAFVAHGNRVLLSYLRTHGGASRESLQAMIAAKNKLIADYRLICEEEPEAAGELRDKLIEAFDRLFARMPPEELERCYECFERTRLAAPVQSPVDSTPTQTRISA